MKILVTGCAGFIGFYLSKTLLKKNIKVYGIDNINNYYDKNLKVERLNILKKNARFFFSRLNICNYKSLNKYFSKNKFDIVIHLAAQAGVRYSIINPRTYLNNNITGFFNVLENSRLFNIKHLIFASTSSVYGSSNNFPLKEHMNTDKPNSFYAATKKSNEIMAYSYSSIYKLPCTALRFFTVYGPYGRPDMALYKFTKALFENKTIDLYNNGDHVRDFTYINDVIESVVKLLKITSKDNIPYQVFNIGNDKPIKLKYFLSLIEKNTKIKAKVNLQNFQIGDVHKTHASINKIKKITKYKNKISMDIGIKKFIAWYQSYFHK